MSNEEDETENEKIMTDEDFFYFDLVVNFWILFLLAFVGIVTNILVLIIFVRQGFKDSANMSLTSIVCWDLLKCLCILVHRLDKPIHLVSPTVGESWFGVTIVYAEFLFVIANHVTYVLATFVSVERCLYVSIPFKVRSILTSSFTLIAVSLISVLVTGAHIVVFALFKVVYVISPHYNVSVADTVYTDFYQIHGQETMVYYNVLGTVLPCTSFVILCLASAVTMYKLRQASSKISRHINNASKLTAKERHSQEMPQPRNATAKERHSMKGTVDDPTSKTGQYTSGAGMTEREKQVNKMLMVVVFVYISNLLPRQVYYIASLIHPQYGLYKLYHNIFVACSKTVFVLDVINAIINLFIFYNMSSSFRATFLDMFECCMKRVT